MYRMLKQVMVLLCFTLSVSTHLFSQQVETEQETTNYVKTIARNIGYGYLFSGLSAAVGLVGNTATHAILYRVPMNPIVMGSYDPEKKNWINTKYFKLNGLFPVGFVKLKCSLAYPWRNSCFMAMGPLAGIVGALGLYAATSALDEKKVINPYVQYAICQWNVLSHFVDLAPLARGRDGDNILNEISRAKNLSSLQKELLQRKMIGCVGLAATIVMGATHIQWMKS